jgi:hypothetical protein
MANVIEAWNCPFTSKKGGFAAEEFVLWGNLRKIKELAAKACWSGSKGFGAVWP